VLPSAGICLEDVERDLIEQALERTEGNKSAAARLLGLTRDTLRYRLERYGLD
jgi:DNA-binding protein Fis